MNKTSLLNKKFSYSQIAYRILILLISSAYAYTLASQPVEEFVDRANYLLYAGDSSAIFDRYLSQGIITLSFNEPIWLLYNAGLSFFLTPEGVIVTTIFLASFATAYLILKVSPAHFLLLTLFLLLPQVLKNNIIHLRQGLAIAVFLMGWFSVRPATRYFFFLMACFIHSSFVVIVFLYFLNAFYNRFRFSSDLRTIIAASIGLLIGIFGVWVAGLVGARQANEYTGDSAAVSGIGFIFWALVAIVFALQGRAFIRRNSLELSIIVFYLSTYFFLPVTARVFESGLLLVLISALQLTSYRKFMFISLFFFYFAIQWGSRLFLPGFGWAT